MGTQLIADSTKINEYFIGEIVEKITQHISIMIGQGVSIVEISSRLVELSKNVTKDITDEFNRFGIEVVNFSISNISIAPEEMQKIQEVMAKKMEVEQLSSVNVGQGYMAVKNIEIMKDAANNTGAAGAMMSGALGAGLGIGAGLPMGQQIAQQVIAQPENNVPQNEPANEDPMAKLKKLKDMFSADLISKEEYDAKRASILEKL